MYVLLAVKGIFRRFRSFVLRREVQIVGQCKLCGSCCHDILLKNRGGWVKRKRQFDKLCEKEPGHERFEIIGRSEAGPLLFACSKQGEDHFCTCYDDRLPLCKSYPSKALYYQGGRLRTDCGFSFKAVTFRDICMQRKGVKPPKFSTMLRQEQEQSDK